MVTYNFHRGIFPVFCRHVNFVLAKTVGWKRRKWSESDRLGGVTQTTQAV
ncbi:MAG: hypothetical protein IJV33_05835 [Bacteroidaceae bacterium]|nr:hypothetical protein [Bacteroidaceae bacterium]